MTTPVSSIHHRVQVHQIRARLGKISAAAAPEAEPTRPQLTLVPVAGDLSVETFPVGAHTCVLDRAGRIKVGMYERSS